jgi:hypothetical protein
MKKGVGKGEKTKIQPENGYFDMTQNGCPFQPLFRTYFQSQIVNYCHGRGSVTHVAYSTAVSDSTSGPDST